MEKVENPTVELLNLIKEDCEEFDAFLFRMFMNSLDDKINDVSAYLTFVRSTFKSTFGAYVKDYPLVKEIKET